MGKLTGDSIKNCTKEKIIVDDELKSKIYIENFDISNLNPNSYNLALSPKLLVYKPRHWWTPWRRPLVWGEENLPDAVIRIPPTGILIKPGWFYLGSTEEWTETYCHVPVLDGRSTTGRVSLHVHVTAGFGDIGFKGCWTLEMYSILPVRVFPHSRICQISYHVPSGDITLTYHGKYSGFNVPVPGR